MFENKRDDAQIKVIDFGLSKKFLDNRIGVMNEGVGECFVCIGVSPTRLTTTSSTRMDNVLAFP